MDGYKLASLAGIVTMSASVCVQNSISCLTQVGQTGQPGMNQPGSKQPAATRPADAQPESALKPATGRELRTQSRSMFELREQGDQQKLDQLAGELVRIEQEMSDTNQRLMRQLGQVRLLDGERKTDALAEVVQGILQDHVLLHGYLSDLRESVTGRPSGSATLPTIEPSELDLDNEIKEDLKLDLPKQDQPEADGPRPVLPPR